MKQLTRSELREKIMTILYQINVYSTNKIEYNVEDIIDIINANKPEEEEEEE